MIGILDDQGLINIGKAKEERERKIKLCVQKKEVKLGIQGFKLLEHCFDML